MSNSYIFVVVIYRKYLLVLPVAMPVVCNFATFERPVVFSYSTLLPGVAFSDWHSA